MAKSRDFQHRKNCSSVKYVTKILGGNDYQYVRFWKIIRKMYKKEIITVPINVYNGSVVSQSPIGWWSPTDTWVLESQNIAVAVRIPKCKTRYNEIPLASRGTRKKYCSHNRNKEVVSKVLHKVAVHAVVEMKRHDLYTKMPLPQVSWTC